MIFTPLNLFLPSQYLSCLTTSRSLTDKLAFDVGLQEDSTGDSKLLPFTLWHIWHRQADAYKPVLNPRGHSRRSLLVDNTSSLQAKVWRREGQGWRWPHSRQCFFRAIPGNNNNTAIFLEISFNYPFKPVLSSASYLASIICKWWLDGGRLLHANPVDHDSCHVWMWTSWRSIDCCC